MEGNNRTAEWMKKEFRRAGKNKGLHVRGAERDIAQKQKQEASGTEKIIQEDGKRRLEIQKFIRTKVEQGYPPDQLFKRLCFIFGKSEYQPYKRYFKTWIMNAIEKQENEQQEARREKDKEEKE